MTHVVFVLFPGVHLLDLAGPAQVFSTAAGLGKPYRLSWFAEHPHVPSAQGLPLTAETTWPAPDPDDLVVVPGWRSAPADPGASGWAEPVPADPGASGWAEPLPADTGASGYAEPGPAGPGVPAGPDASGDAEPVPAGPTLAALRAHHAAGGTVASVCSGAMALGRAGLLDGRRCTTHHDLQDRLAARYPRASVVRDVLFTSDDRVVTSAGIASGIDLALHLLAVRHGPALAARVARDMVVYTRRNGDEPQASAVLRHRSHLSDTVHHVQDLIDTHYAEALSLNHLAAHAGVSARTLTRLFTRATGPLPEARTANPERYARPCFLTLHLRNP